MAFIVKMCKYVGFGGVPETLKMVENTLRMDVTVNQNKKSLEQGTTIKDLIESYGYEAYGEGLAVAINDHVIPKDQWDEYTIAEHDDVTLIQATQGG